jgi:hypothetical protein
VIQRGVSLTRATGEHRAHGCGLYKLSSRGQAALVKMSPVNAWAISRRKFEQAFAPLDERGFL